MTEELKKEIQNHIRYYGQPVVEWDSRIDDLYVQKIISGQYGEGEFIDDFLDAQLMDYMFCLQDDYIEKLIEELKEDIPEKEEESIRDELMDIVFVDLNLSAAFQPIPARVVLYSTYDCINSNWFERGLYPYEPSYFKDMVDILYLNPKILKKELLAYGFSVQGRYPDYSWRNGKEFISYKDFINELWNSCSPVNLLVFLGMLDISETIKKPFKISVPKGNKCGLFSSWYGGGGPLDMTLQRDFVIKLDKPRKTEYDYLSLLVDSQNSYSIKSVYDTDDSIFGGEIEILE